MTSDKEDVCKCPPHQEGSIFRGHIMGKWWLECPICHKTTMTDKEAIEKARKELTGYSDTDKAIIELINHLIARYEISLYDLECWNEHECDRCDH